MDGYLEAPMSWLTEQLLEDSYYKNFTDELDKRYYSTNSSLSNQS